MKNSFKFLTIGLTLVLLLVWQSSFDRASAASITTQDTVEWMESANSADPAIVTFYRPGTGTATTTAAFFILDDDLETTEDEKATWGQMKRGVETGVTFTLATGSITAYTTPAEGFLAPDDLDGNYDLTTTSNTPLVSDPTITTRAYGTATDVGQLVTSSNLNAGTFAIFNSIAASSTVVADFSYHVQDVYAAAVTGATVDVGENRAKVTSSSDSVGEWITISEVTDEGFDTASPTAKIFRGRIYLGTDASFQTADDNAVWVQDGDTLTVTFYEDDHATIIDSTTATIDSSDPVISAVVPADGSIISDNSPTVGFTIEDSGSGFDSSAPGGNVALEIRGCRVEDDELSFPFRTSSKIDVQFSLSPAAADWTISSKTGGTSSITCNGSTRQQTPSGGGSTQYSGFGVDASNIGTVAISTTPNNQNSHGVPFTWKIVATDQAGNSVTLETTDLELQIDSTAPDMLSASTGVGWDAVNEVTTTDLNSIQIIFTESLDDSTFEASDFAVDGVTPTSITVAGVNVAEDTTTTAIEATTGNQQLNEMVFLEMANALVANSRPKIEFVGSGADLAGNVLEPATGETVADTITQSGDGIFPTITDVASSAQLLAEDGTATVTFTSDEALTGTATGVEDCTCLSISGIGTAAGISSDISSAKGTVSLTTPTSATADVDESGSLDKSGIYGVIINARDQFANAGQVGAVEVSDEVVSDQITGTNVGTTITVQIDSWPIADSDGDGTLADEFSVEVNGIAVTTVTATDIDWGEAETVDLTLSTVVDDNDTVTVTYNYVTADQAIEVDLIGPAITFEPLPASTTENPTPFIIITFDDDEYAGDTFTTVTVTKATLTEPGGGIVNILDSLSTTDNIVFTYLPTDPLALGEYTITASGKDAAANETVNASGNFTVAARALKGIALNPGWNLISLPAEPASSAINDVITVAEITTVLTYDPTVAGGWLTAVRDDEGNLAGTLDTIDARHGYWVYTTTHDPITVDIPGLAEGAATLPPSIALIKGWNLVAAVSLDTAFDGTTGSEIDSDTYFTGLDWTRGYRFDAATRTFIGFIPTTAADTEIRYGLGYWVFVREAGDLVP